MKDPERLLENGASDVERMLLRAAVLEEPAVDGRARLAALLGVSSGLATGLSSSSTSAATGFKAAAGKLALVLGAVGSAAAVAYLATSPLAAGLPARNTNGSHEGARAAEVSRAPAVAPSPPTEGFRETPGFASPSPVGALAPDPSPSVPFAKSAPGLVPASPAARSIAEEIRALDVARRALAEGRVPSALVALEGYERAYPTGMLHQEATLLRIEALVRAGDRTSARRLGERFLRSHPRSPHEQRIRSLLGDATP